MLPTRPEGKSCHPDYFYKGLERVRQDLKEGSYASVPPGGKILSSRLFY